MKRSSLAVLATLSILSACAATSPAAVSCPAPPPAPAVLLEPPSTGPTLMQQFESSLQKFRDRLKKALTPLALSTP